MKQILHLDEVSKDSGYPTVDKEIRITVSAHLKSLTSDLAIPLREAKTLRTMVPEQNPLFTRKLTST